MIKCLAVTMAVVALSLPAGSANKDDAKKLPASLWRNPGAISARNLYYGMGGTALEPGAGVYTFVKEDLDGNSPKFVVRDSRGVEWKVKVGAEARPETVATRLVWAVGYSTDEDYFIPTLLVRNMPAKLSRGGEYVSADGMVHDARWERMDHKKVGLWRWRKNPFSKTRELDGLRVLMSLLNNYDMKDSQNSIYEEDGAATYVVSDLGAVLGATGSRWPAASLKGNLDVYSRADFIKKVTEKHVDFAAPSWPMMIGVIPTPPLPYSWITYPMKLFNRDPVPNVYMQRWIGKGIPRENVRWIAGLLKRLSASQIRDAFRAAHYPPAEAEAFSRAVEKRIAALTEL